MKALLAYITVDTPENARKIGKVLLEKKVAACINIIPGMESHYWWEGKIEEAKETILIAKTSSENSETLIRLVKSIHPYDVPCILILPIETGNTDYLHWLESNLNS